MKIYLEGLDKTTPHFKIPGLCAEIRNQRHQNRKQVSKPLDMTEFLSNLLMATYIRLQLLYKLTRVYPKFSGLSR